MLFDTHAHYDARRFDEDRHQLLGFMKENGVGRILNAGCDLESSRAAVELAHQYDFVWAAWTTTMRTCHGRSRSRPSACRWSWPGS